MFISWFRDRRRNGRAARRLQEHRRRFQVEEFEGRQLLSTIVVTNANDSGTGSLRSAIIQANNATTPTTIDFGLPGTSNDAINLLSALPPITQPVVIDGTSQSGYGGYPGIELNGASAGSTAVGLQLTSTASGSTIEGLLIDSFGGGGVLVDGGSGDLITNNYIDVNGAYGVELDQSSNDIVSLNTVAGNATYGVEIAGAAATKDVVNGGIIDSNGIAGVYLNGGASGITVGGVAGVAHGVASDSIVISGNKSYGVEIVGGGGDLVEGAYIGTDGSGAVAWPNGIAGVYLNGGTTGNTIGGTTAGARDLLSGNGAYGVEIVGGGGNRVEGDFIGTDLNGTTALGNGTAGVYLAGGTSGNVVGAPEQFVGNHFTPSDVISGNGTYGVEIVGATGNVVEGDLIGTDLTGKVALRNTIGVLLSSGATQNTIGGSLNVISGNLAQGVEITGAGTTGNVVLANQIGTDINGNVALPNLDGVLISSGAAGNTIGSATSGYGNRLSGNGAFGVLISGTGTAGNLVEGNSIGVDAYPGTALPNLTGVGIVAGATNNTVGGTTAGAGNIIAGNGYEGVVISDAGTTGNLVEGNSIGLNPNVAFPVPNANASGIDGYGVLVENGASGNTIGGTAVGAGNVISGNGSYGVVLSGPGTSHNLVAGDLIGTDATGTMAISSTQVFNPQTMTFVTAIYNLGNGIGGVLLTNGSALNTIGGTAAGARNIISANLEYGVEIAGASGNLVEGDSIGTDVTGTQSSVFYGADPLGNGVAGVFIHGPSAGNTIGGTAAGTRDIISGNGLGYLGGGANVGGAAPGGVSISDPGATGNLIEGDFIGTDVTGTLGLGNFVAGVTVGNGASGTTVGGAFAAARDIISANHGAGVRIMGAGLTLVEGDLIGTDVTGTAALGNSADGVFIGGAAGRNTVGGTTAGTRDIISANGGAGVDLEQTGTAGQVVEGDYIGTDATGKVGLGNRGGGVLVGSSGNTLGGTVAGSRDVISGNAGDGIELFGTAAIGNLVEGDFIGTDVNGSAALGNTYDGVGLINGASYNTIGGAVTAARNVISSNADDGVDIDAGVSVKYATRGNVVEGNFIGTDVSGRHALPNQYGVVIADSASGNVVGGAVAGSGNVISGNARDGIRIQGGGTSTNAVEGNLIGTNVAGTAALSNGGSGVAIFAGASGNTIGGPAAADRNIISGNTYHGVYTSDPGTDNNLIQGDDIGTDLTGSVAVPNGFAGVLIKDGASSNAVYDDVISGNGLYGVWILGAGANNNRVAFDLIGVNAADTAVVKQPGRPYSSLDGVKIDTGPSGNLVADNVISGNYYGVEIDGSATSNTIEYNEIGDDFDETLNLGNVASGVFLVGTNGNHVFSNYITNNGGFGIQFVSSGRGQDEGNAFANDALGNED